MNAWEAVFSRSRVNAGYYDDEERLPQNRWKWPKYTRLQSHRDYLRQQLLRPRQKIRTGDHSPMEQPGTIFMEF